MKNSATDRAVALQPFGSLSIWLFGHLAFGQLAFGQLAFGHLAIWLFGLFAFQPFSLSAHRLFGSYPQPASALSHSTFHRLPCRTNTAALSASPSSRPNNKYGLGFPGS